MVEIFQIEEDMENKTQVQFADLLARVDSRFRAMGSEMDSRFETMRSEMKAEMKELPTRSEVEAAVAKSSLARTVQTIGWAVAVVASLLGGIFVF